jgi:hypothetical protein
VLEAVGPVVQVALVVEVLVELHHQAQLLELLELQILAVAVVVEAMLALQMAVLAVRVL